MYEWAICLFFVSSASTEISRFVHHCAAATALDHHRFILPVAVVCFLISLSLVVIAYHYKHSLIDFCFFSVVPVIYANDFCSDLLDEAMSGCDGCDGCCITESSSRGS